VLENKITISEFTGYF